jgi:formamidopyrimidine-DNA glycosylase
MAPVMEGVRFRKVEARRPDLRFPFPKDFALRLKDQTVTGLGRRAKYLLADLSSGDVLVMHLGMSGSFRIAKNGTEDAVGEFHHPRSEALVHDHVVFHMSSGATVTFNDPRRFGFMTLIPRERLAEDKMMRAIGPEPLGNEFDAAMLATACAGKKTSLKAALSDQRVVAGLGNIYVCEALHRAKLSPKRIASTLALRSGEPHERAISLVESIKHVLNEAISAGGSTLRDHRQPDGELGYFQHTFRVYDREGSACTRRDGGRIRRIVQGARSTFYCPVCQR